MGLLIDVTPYLKTIPGMTDEEISNIKTRQQLAQIIQKNNLTDKIPLSIQLKNNFIFLKNVSKNARKYGAYSKGYITLKGLIQNTHGINWTYNNNSNMEEIITNLAINSDASTNIEELNIKAVAINNLYRTEVAYDNLIEDFKSGKLEDDAFFHLLEESLKKYYEENNELESMVETMKYCYRNYDKDEALFNMACLSVLVTIFDMSVELGPASFYHEGDWDCNIVIDKGSKRKSKTHCHELGHAIYSKLRNRKTPTDMKRLIEELSGKNIDKVEEFIKNIEKYYDYNMDIYHQKIEEWREKYKESYYSKLENCDRNNYSVFLEEVRKLCKSEEIYQDLLHDLDFFLPEEEYRSLDEKEYKSRLDNIFNKLFDHNNSMELDRDITMKLDAVVGLAEDLLSGIYVDNYTSDGFALNYGRFHLSDYYYDMDFEIRYEDKVFSELFANYNALRMTNQKIPLELVQLLGEELFQNLISVYEGIPQEKVELEKYVATSPIITKEITEYQHQDSKPNRYYIKYSEESRDSLRLGKIPMMDALRTEEIKKYGKKEGTNRFINSLLNYYERNCDGMDTKTLETYASHSDGEIINIINQRINAEDMNGEPVFTEEEKRKLEKRRDEVLYDTLKMLKEEDLLENLNFPTAYLEPGQSPTYDDKLYEVDEGYLDYNNPNASRIEYYKKYIDRLNIEYYANITLEDDSMVTEISNHMYDLFDDDQYDITKIKKVFITKDEKREQETEEERKEGTLVFQYDESPIEITRRLEEQCKKESRTK